MRFVCFLLIACSAAPMPSRPPPPMTAEERAKREQALDRARAMPDGVERAIWIGRRLGYLHRYREAIDVFGDAIEKYPRDARLYRHRGHRYITLRQFDRAVSDLRRASELVKGTKDSIEPDGMPNAANIPTSTLHGNIAYHLALAYHVLGDFASSRAHFKQSFDLATTEDMRVAAAYWLYLTEMHATGRSQALDRLPASVELLENHAYWSLIELFRKRITLDELRARDHEQATVGYGIAMFHLFGNNKPACLAELKTTVSGDSWPSFGFIAAEAALSRLQ